MNGIDRPSNRLKIITSSGWCARLPSLLSRLHPFAVSIDVAWMNSSRVLITREKAGANSQATKFSS